MGPPDGIVRATARNQQGLENGRREGARDQRMIVENTFRNRRRAACGLGDIRFMLETRIWAANAPISNALTLASARGPAPSAATVYGIRIAKSKWDTKSLGTSSRS